VGRETRVPADADRSTREFRLRDGLGFCVAVFLAVRVGLSILAVLGVQDRPLPTGAIGAAGPGNEQPATSGWHNAVDGMHRWDAYWYESIAAHGYDASGNDAAFFPGYPAGIATLSAVPPIGVDGAALLIANAAFLLSLIVLFGVTSYEFDPTIARRTVLFAALFPTAFFFMAPYSESPFFVCVLLSFWWIRRGRWAPGTLAAAAAAFVRPIGVVLIPCLIIEAVTQPEEERGSRTARLIASFAPLIPLAVYSTYWLVRTGDALAPFHAQSGWMRSLVFPLVTVAEGVELGIRGFWHHNGIYWTADVVIFALALVPLCLRWRELPRTYVVYATLSLLVPLTFPLPARPLVSIPRFVIVVFPVYWALSLLFERPLARRVALVASTIGLAIASLAFMNWGFLF
jgi:Mannosyltransferase (PIG-V)